MGLEIYFYKKTFLGIHSGNSIEVKAIINSTPLEHINPNKVCAIIEEVCSPNHLQTDILEIMQRSTSFEECGGEFDKTELGYVIEEMEEIEPSTPEGKACLIRTIEHLREALAIAEKDERVFFNFAFSF